MRSDDRIIQLSKIEGKNTLSSQGLIDNRLFTGVNKLHAIREPNGLWVLSYENGILEKPLQQRFTSFSTVMKFLKDYYYKRNVKIEEVQD